MVAGGFKNDLTALNDLTPHDDRYVRLVEYAAIIQSLLLTTDAVSFEGRYYKVNNLKLTPPLPAKLMPGLMVSGSSEAGMQAARQLGATAIEYPKPPAEYAAAPDADDATSNGIRIGIIARPQEADAWTVARTRYPEDRKGQITHQLAMKVSDSSWHRQLSELGDYPLGRRESVLAGAVPELQGHLPFSGRQLRSGGGRSGALCRRRLPHLHSRRAREYGRDGAHRHGVRTRRGALPRMMSPLLQQGVVAQAQARPEATALVFKGTRLTYGALEETTNRLANLLKDAGCQRGDRVGLLMPKMPMAIVAMLGVLKADAIYVPMDPASPSARQARVLEISDCCCILAAGPVGQTLQEALTAATLRQRPIIGWLDEGVPSDVDPQPAFSSTRSCRISGDPPGVRQQRRRRGAHPVHIGIHRIAQGRDDHARSRRASHRVGAVVLWHRFHGPHFTASAVAFRRVHVRHIRHALVRRRTASRARRAESAAAQAGAVHSRFAGSRSGSRCPRFST